MKNALVTGVSWTTGIGFAISKQLIADGFYVYAVYHSEDSDAKVFYDQNPDNIEFVQCDLSKRNSLNSLMLLLIMQGHLVVEKILIIMILKHGIVFLQLM